MPKVRVNGVALWYEMAGGKSDDVVVLVHGSWADHTAWQQVVPRLAQSFRVLTYDRRGHGQSESMPGQGTRQEDETDLAGLLEALDLAPAHVAGQLIRRLHRSWNGRQETRHMSKHHRARTTAI